MKKLSIEEKAKRYDEILARATGVHLPYYTEDIMTKVKEFVEYLLPELKKESEDERIINNIKKVIGWYRGMFTEKSLMPEQYQEINAWLKKQGENISLPKFTFDDVLALQCCMETVKKVQEDKELYEQLQSLHDRLHDAYWLEKKGEKNLTPIFRIGDTIIAKDGTYIEKEPFHIDRIEDDCYWDGENTILVCNQDEFEIFKKKPADKIEPKFKVGDKVKSVIDGFECTIESIDNTCYYGDTTNFDIQDQDGWELVEQKPAEWSEEDEYCIHQLIVFCENCMIPDSGAKRCAHWLKSLKGRVGCEANCTTTKEWSEDDQSNFNELSSFILEIYRAEDASRLLIWFKSLKERVQPDKGWIPIKESFYTNNVVLAQKKDKSDVWEGYTVIADHTLDPLVFERYINIENISTQPLWKPSEAQIMALRWVLNNVPYNKYKEEISGLLDQIKEL